MNQIPSLANVMEQEMLLHKSVLVRALHNSRLTEVPSHFSIIPMSDTEFRQLHIHYNEANTPIGTVLLASTGKGICFTGFIGNCPVDAWLDLQRRFPKATFSNKTDTFQETALSYITQPHGNTRPLPFHLRGTAFQLGIWQRLLQIPFGALTTYSDIGESKLMARATGTAVGANPVSYFIPCHRVIRSNGEFHGYFWGLDIKRRLLQFESLHK
ncbi:MAG TPA: methylated-DNA--[protein]-cysteine S-methyltransferase [Chitinophaga sp.]